MNENKRTPQIRFKGFTDDWEQRKLEDITQIVMGQSPDSINYTDNSDDTVLIQGNADLNNGIVVPRIWSSQITKKSYPNDIIFTVRAPVGEIARNPYFATIGRGVASFKGNDFLYQSLIQKKENNYWNNISAGSTFDSINSDQLKNVIIYLPKNNLEQEKIGELFTNLDNLITLHQRKYDKLVNMKKSMLEKMFPKNSEKVPEIRFKGFTDDWEQRKVTDIGKLSIGLVTTMTSHYTDKGTLLIRNSDIKDNHFEFGEEPIYLDEEFANKNANRKHEIGDVITVHTGDVGTSAVIDKNTDKSIGFATIITRPNLKIIDSYYLSTFLNTEKHKKWAISISTGDGRTNYNLGDYQKLVVPLTSVDEQRKIARFILNIDNLITLHQRKLEKLNNLKKSMLEKMFV